MCVTILTFADGTKEKAVLIEKTASAFITQLQEQGITDGCVFVTKNGQPLDRSNIWKMMKRTAEAAKVKTKKVYPHNLRHLFAQTYYQKYKDIVRLADILGHSNVDTTRIYTAKNGQEQQKQIERLSLLL